MNKKSLVKQYEQEGYVIVRNVLDANLVAEARAHIDWLLKKNPQLRPEQLGHHLMTKDAFWVRLVSDDRLLDIAEQFLGPDVGLFASHYIAKPPRTGKAVPWHQDGSYWPLEPMRVITFWLAIDRSDEENGCMKVVPRTHHDNLISLDDYVPQTDENAFEVAMEPGSVDESQAVNLILNPGDISIHHPNVTHGSNVNDSPRWRRGLTIRYIPTSTRITTNYPHPAAFILRGKGVANGNGWNPLPFYNKESSLTFADRDEWDKTCVVKNTAYRAFLPQQV